MNSAIAAPKTRNFQQKCSRLGVLAFSFFLLKGLVWLSLPILAQLWLRGG